MKRTVVLLDLDGTLVDTNATHAESYLRAFAAFGHSVSYDAIARQVGKGGDKLVPALIGDEAAAQDGEAIRNQAATLFTDVLAQARTFSLFPGAVELIDALEERGCPMAIATSSDGKFLDAIFQSAGVDLRKRVQAVTTKSDVEESKPEDDILQAALAKLGARPEDAILIGDTIYDFQAAEQAGVTGIGVTTWVWDEAALLQAGAEFAFPDLVGVLDHLDEILELRSVTGM